VLGIAFPIEIVGNEVMPQEILSYKSSDALRLEQTLNIFEDVCDLQVFLFLVPCFSHSESLVESISSVFPYFLVQSFLLQVDNTLAPPLIIIIDLQFVDQTISGIHTRLPWYFPKSSFKYTYLVCANIRLNHAK
jgi:hypothetical protein